MRSVLGSIPGGDQILKNSVLLKKKKPVKKKPVKEREYI